MIGYWISGFCIGFGVALILRWTLDQYVAEYKRKHHQEE